MFKSLRLASSALALMGILLTGCSSRPTQPAVDTGSIRTPVAATPAPASAPVSETQATHAVVGEVEHVDPAGHHMTVRTASGSKHRVELQEHTRVNSLVGGLKEIGKGTADVTKSIGSSVKTGTMVAVRYTEKEGKLLAHEIQHVSKEVAKSAVGVVHKVEDGGKKVFVKTEEGTEHVFEVSKDVTVAADRKIVGVGKVTGEKISTEAKATFHFTEDAGRKILHFVNR